MVGPDFVGYRVGFAVGPGGSPIPPPTNPNLKLMRKGAGLDFLLASDWDVDEREDQGYVEVPPSEA